MDPEELARRSLIRNAERKLATRPSRRRVVRKLPRTMVVIRKKQPGPVTKVRTAINMRKRLVYIVLLGATLGLYIHDVELDRLQNELNTVQQTVEEARAFYLGA